MTWRTIPDWPDYEISKSGVVRRRVPSQRGHAKGYVLLPNISKRDGYHSVLLSNRTKARRLKVYRLVLETYVGPCPSPQHEGAHWNRDKGDNRLRNLRWATKVENQNDKRRHQTDGTGERNPRAKLKIADVRRIRRLALEGMRHHDIGLEFDMSSKYIWRVVHGATWGHVA